MKSSGQCIIIRSFTTRSFSPAQFIKKDKCHICNSEFHRDETFIYSITLATMIVLQYTTPPKVSKELSCDINIQTSDSCKARNPEIFEGDTLTNAFHTKQLSDSQEFFVRLVGSHTDTNVVSSLNMNFTGEVVRLNQINRGEKSPKYSCLICSLFKSLHQGGDLGVE